MTVASLVIPAKFLQLLEDSQERFILFYSPADMEPSKDDWEVYYGETQAFGITAAQAFGQLMAELFPPEPAPEDT